MLVERFRIAGFKITPQRMAAFQFLKGNTSYPSAYEVYKVVKRRLPTTSFATIYKHPERRPGDGIGAYPLDPK